MKSKEVLLTLTLLCLIALLLEVNLNANRPFAPLWYPVTGWHHEWFRLIILVLGILVLQPLYKQGHRWSLVPVVIAVCILNPPGEWFRFSRPFWQPWAFGAVVFAAHIPGVRNLTARLWRD